MQCCSPPCRSTPLPLNPSGRFRPLCTRRPLRGAPRSGSSRREPGGIALQPPHTPLEYFCEDVRPPTRRAAFRLSISTLARGRACTLTTRATPPGAVTLRGGCSSMTRSDGCDHDYYLKQASAGNCSAAHAAAGDGARRRRQLRPQVYRLRDTVKFARRRSVDDYVESQSEMGSFFGLLGHSSRWEGSICCSSA